LNPEGSRVEYMELIGGDRKSALCNISQGSGWRNQAGSERPRLGQNLVLQFFLAAVQTASLQILGEMCNENENTTNRQVEEDGRKSEGKGTKPLRLCHVFREKGVGKRGGQRPVIVEKRSLDRHDDVNIKSAERRQLGRRQVISKCPLSAETGETTRFDVIPGTKGLIET